MSLDGPVIGIDKALAKYYHELGDYDYFDNDGLGKFLRFCRKEGFDEDAVDEEMLTDNEQNCELTGFDKDFPFEDHIHPQNEAEFNSEVFLGCRPRCFQAYQR